MTALHWFASDVHAGSFVIAAATAATRGASDERRPSGSQDSGGV